MCLWFSIQADSFTTVMFLKDGMALNNVNDGCLETRKETTEILSVVSSPVAKQP